MSDAIFNASTASITVGTNAAVTLVGPVVVAQDITLESNATLRLQGRLSGLGTIEHAPGAANAIIELSTGANLELAVNGVNLVTLTNASLTGVVLLGDVQITVNPSVTLTAGSINVSGGQLTISGAGTFAGARFTNSLGETGDVILTSSAVVSDAIFNASTASITVPTGVSITFSDVEINSSLSLATGSTVTVISELNANDNDIVNLGFNTNAKILLESGTVKLSSANVLTIIEIGTSTTAAALEASSITNAGTIVFANASNSSIVAGSTLTTMPAISGSAAGSGVVTVSLTSSGGVFSQSVGNIGGSVSSQAAILNLNAYQVTLVSGAASIVGELDIALTTSSNNQLFTFTGGTDFDDEDNNTVFTLEILHRNTKQRILITLTVSAAETSVTFAHSSSPLAPIQ